MAMLGRRGAVVLTAGGLALAAGWHGKETQQQRSRPVSIPSAPFPLPVKLARAQSPPLSSTPTNGFTLAPESEEKLLAALREAQPKTLETSDGQQDIEASNVWRIVLTGGPCGGKSTAMHHLQERLTALGFVVFVVPEAATLVITGGGMWKDYPSFSANQALCFEGTVMGTKIALEDAFYAIAKASGEPCVILCDRGTMDTKAYVSNEDFQVLMDEYNWSATQLRDRRYDAVIHLVTASIGAEQFYTTENNTARTETPEEAAILDFKVLNAWVGHPNMRIIDNSTDFMGKMKRTINHVCKVVGAPRPAAVTRKFVVNTTQEYQPPPGVSVEDVSVEQTYLLKGEDKDTTGFIFVKKRGQNGAFTYSHSVRRKPPSDASGTESDEVCAVERQISGREYIALCKQADPFRRTIKKEVKCFVHDRHYFELQTYVDCGVELTVLQTETETPDEVINIPSWLEIHKEVTDDPLYSSHSLSRTGGTGGTAQ